MKIEDKKPNENGNGKPYKSVGYMITKTSNGVLLEIWQDDGTSKDPKNRWKKIKNWKQAPPKHSPPSDHQP